MSETETDVERELRRVLREQEAPIVADLTPFVRQAMQRARRQRRAAAVTGVCACVLALVAAAALLGRGDPQEGTDPVTPLTGVSGATETASPALETADCSEVKVWAKGERPGELVLVLRNAGPDPCDVRALELTAGIGSRVQHDRATVEDIATNDPLVDVPLPPAAQFSLKVATDVCQNSGIPIVISFTDGSELDLAFPGLRGACDQPDFKIEITDLRSSAMPEQVDPVD